MVVSHSGRKHGNNSGDSTDSCFRNTLASYIQLCFEHLDLGSQQNCQKIVKSRFLLLKLFLQTKISVAEDYFGSGGIFSITVYSGLSLFVVLIAAGLGWEMYRKRKKKTRKQNGQIGE